MGGGAEGEKGGGFGEMLRGAQSVGAEKGMVIGRGSDRRMRRKLHKICRRGEFDWEDIRADLHDPGCRDQETEDERKRASAGRLRGRCR